MRMTKPVKILVVSTATVFGLAGAAAAATGPFTPFEGDDPVLETTTVPTTEAPSPESTEAPPESTTAPESETTAPTLAPEPESESTEDDADAEEEESTEFECPEGAANHGEVVSSVARETPPGPGHGAAVSEAAKSDCGKPEVDDEADDETEEGADDDAVEDEVEGDDAVEAEAGTVDERGSSHGKGAGHGNANRGQGKGRGRD
jgi:hypothetical protein